LWLASAPWLIVLVMAGSFVLWLWNREPAPTALKYGELVQILTAAKNDPGITVRNVRVGRTDIRGEIVTSHPVSGGETDRRQETVTAFRAQRVGLEDDRELHALLREAVGPGYQGEEEESPFKGVYSFILSAVLFIGLAVGLLFFIRWRSGGGSPFSF